MLQGKDTPSYSSNTTASASGEVLSHQSAETSFLGRNDGARGVKHFAARGRSPQRGGGRHPGASRPPGGGGSAGSKHAFAAGGRIHGHGSEAILFERDGSTKAGQAIWKVGPVAGHRFQLHAFLRGLSAFVLARPYADRSRPRPPPAPPASLRPKDKGSLTSTESVEVEVRGAFCVAGASPATDEKRAAVESAFAMPVESTKATATMNFLLDLAEEKREESEDDDASAGFRSCDESDLQAASVQVESEAATMTSAVTQGEEGPVVQLQEALRTAYAGPNITYAGQIIFHDATIPELTAQDHKSDRSPQTSPPAAHSSETSATTKCGSLDGSTAISNAHHHHVEQDAEQKRPAASKLSCRSWWPLDEATTSTPYHAPPSVLPVLLSIRLERLDLSDNEVEMFVDWAEQAQTAGAARITKLWLFGNRIADHGAAAIARLIRVTPELKECHLSHNMVTLVGATQMLQALPVVESACSGESLWFRLEWNRISLTGLADVLDEEYNGRGLIADLPEAVRQDATPALPRLPTYLAQAEAPANKTSGMTAMAAAGFDGNESTPRAVSGSVGFRGGRNSLKSLVEQCHVRLPWISCQFELPSEAAVLRSAKLLWRTQPRASSSDTVGQEGSSVPSSIHLLSRSQSAQAVEATREEDVGSSTSGCGPLLFVMDTSALLAMLGARSSVTVPTFFTLKWLASLASKSLFGRALPPSQRAFLLVPASVATQLDALKADPGVKTAVRWFMSRGLDECGPACHDFLAMLGAHEGEGLVLEHGAEVTGSRGADVASRGQQVRARCVAWHLAAWSADTRITSPSDGTYEPRTDCPCFFFVQVDHRIVEVALFFLRECLEALASNSSQGADPESETPIEGACVHNAGEFASPSALHAPIERPTGLSSNQLVSDVFPVCLITGDNGQLQLAKAHGLPAIRISELTSCLAHVKPSIDSGQHALTASVLREKLRPAASRGLGTVVARSMQTEFDGAIACLHAAVDALAEIEERTTHAVSMLEDDEHQQMSLKERVCQARKVLQTKPSVKNGVHSGGGGLVEVLRKRLDDWESVVKSHQSPSRVLTWCAPNASPKHEPQT
jgi:hypothetical protein